MSIALIKTENLRKEFGSHAAVKGLTLQVEQGEVFGFLGPNGAGKTTSIKMLLGLVLADIWSRVITLACRRATAPHWPALAFCLNISAFRNGSRQTSFSNCTANY